MLPPVPVELLLVALLVVPPLVLALEPYLLALPVLPLPMPVERPLVALLLVVPPVLAPEPHLLALPVLLLPTGSLERSLAHKP